MKCTLNTNYSTYILYEFFIKRVTFGVLYHDYTHAFKKFALFGGGNIYEMFPT